jgi:hypothetical protein
LFEGEHKVRPYIVAEMMIKARKSIMERGLVSDIFTVKNGL